jgi:hypothetical protein
MIHRITAILLIASGISLFIYGADSIYEPSHFSLNKYTNDGRDTGGSILFIIVGFTLFGYGLFKLITSD